MEPYDEWTWLFDPLRKPEILLPHAPQYEILDDAAINSAARFPPPRCHPNTRKSLRYRIRTWAECSDSDRGMLWIMGSAGTGKSALAQTIAEEFQELALLGAAVFLSRPNKRNDPYRVIPTLADQLSAKNSEYEDRVKRWTGSNRDFTSDQPLRTQFEVLIGLFPRRIPRRPSPTLNLRPLPSRLIVILDALDECEGEEAQCDLITLISDHISNGGPLLWVICSRPEPHLEHTFRQAEARGFCWVEELRVDDPEAQSDVECYLRDEFNRIAKGNSSIIGKDGTWPPKALYDKIVSASSGLFIFATTVVRVIDQPGSNPDSQLTAVVAAIEGSPIPQGAPNPLAVVDRLYLEILERSPSHILPTTLELLGICATCPPLPVLHLTQLLNIDLNVIHEALRSLHSIITVPYRGKLTEEPLQFYHASFTDFLFDPIRSRQFSLKNHNFYHRLIAEACLRVLAHTKTSSADDLEWDASDFDAVNPSNLFVSHHLLVFAATHFWDTCTKISYPALKFVRDKVAGLDFRCLRFMSNLIPVQSFVKFLRWLCALTNNVRGLSNIIRTRACCDLDSRFLERCAGIGSQSLDLNTEFGGCDIEDVAYHVLIGFEVKTVLILVVPDSVVVYAMEDIDDI